MAPRYPTLDTHLEETGTDGYLIDADGEDSNQYYLSGYHAPDNFVTVYADGEVRLLTSTLEYTRANTDSDGDAVHRLSEFDYGDLVDEHGKARARPYATVAFLEASGVGSVSVPVSFPTGTADLLREQGIEVHPDYDDVVGATRGVKTEAEVEHIRETQRATEEAMAAAEEMLERADVEGGELTLDGELLTSERVRETIELTLLEAGCGLSDCIVASGPECAQAHSRGSGPIAEGDPITIDIFPRNLESRYFSDMTRTYVKGEPDERIREWYDLTREAHDVALETIAAGVTGAEVHDAVCDVFEEAGYPTLRTDESTEDGFFHSTGHGVGLDVHEPPRLGRGGETLEPGHVVTVEPGLYEQGVGGVRLEDIVVVTETGCENLTEYPRELGVV